MRPRAAQLCIPCLAQNSVCCNYGMERHAVCVQQGLCGVSFWGHRARQLHMRAAAERHLVCWDYELQLWL